MSATLINLIIQLIAGAVGGNAAGAAMKNVNLGTLGNTIAGAIGGAGGGTLLTALLPMTARLAPSQSRPQVVMQQRLTKPRNDKCDHRLPPIQVTRKATPIKKATMHIPASAPKIRLSPLISA